MMVFRDQDCCSVTMEAGVEEEEGGCWSETCLAGTGGLVLDAKPKHILLALIFSTNNYINKSMLSIKFVCHFLVLFFSLQRKESFFSSYQIPRHPFTSMLLMFAIPLLLEEFFSLIVGFPGHHLSKPVS